jgi:hypothetical protein
MLGGAISKGMIAQSACFECLRLINFVNSTYYLLMLRQAEADGRREKGDVKGKRTEKRGGEGKGGRWENGDRRQDMREGDVEERRRKK